MIYTLSKGHSCQSFQVTLLQVADLQWVPTGAVLGLIASNSGLSLAPSSRTACGLVTIDTTVTPPVLEAGFLGVHSASWKRRSKCPSAVARRSTSSSWSFLGEAGAPA